MIRQLQPLSPAGLILYPWAQQRLISWEKLRKETGIPPFRKVIPLLGYTITILVAGDASEIRIEGGGVSGFLFHPRDGNLVYRAFARTDGTAESHLMVNGNGWDPSGKVLPVGSFAYPLIDDDHGTRNIYRESDTWQFEADPAGENYGNVDWKGKNSTPGAKPPDAPVLTWKGPSSRYGSFPSNLNADGYATVEEQINPDGLNPETYYTVFSPYVYEGGEAIATAPPSWPEGGVWKNALVQGAAYFNDILVIVANVNYRNNKAHEPGFFHTLFAEINGKWVNVWERNLGRARYCWFFSESGGKAVSVFDGTIHRLSLSLAGENVTATYAEEGAGGIVFTLNATTTHEEHTQVPASLPIGWQVDGRMDEISPYIGKKNGRSSQANTTGSYSGTVVLAADFKGEEEVLFKVTGTGTESSEKKTKADTVFGLTDYLTDVDLINFDPDTYVPTITTDGTYPAMDIGSNVCKGQLSFSCGELTKNNIGDWQLDTTKCFGDCLTGMQEKTVNLAVQGDYYNAQKEVVISHDFGGVPSIIVSGLSIIGSETSTTYSGGGGTAPYTFAISKIDAGSCAIGSINAATGVWSKGASAGGIMRVTATDACGYSGYMDVRLPSGSWVTASDVVYADCSKVIFNGCEKLWGCANETGPCNNAVNAATEESSTTKKMYYGQWYASDSCCSPYQSRYPTGPDPSAFTAPYTLTQTCGGVCGTTKTVDFKTYRLITQIWQC